MLPLVEDQSVDHLLHFDKLKPVCIGLRHG